MFAQSKRSTRVRCSSAITGLAAFKTHCRPQALHGWFCFPWLCECGLSDDLSRTT